MKLLASILILSRSLGKVQVSMTIVLDVPKLNVKIKWHALELQVPHRHQNLAHVQKA